MTLGERIKKVRKGLDLTQRDFGAQIGTTQNAIASYEIGRREPSAAAINNICKTFNVDEHWLRTGEGEIFLPKAGTTLELLTAEHGLTGGDRALIEKFLSLKPEDRRILVDYVREVASAIANQEDAVPAFAPAPTPIIEAEARAEANQQEIRTAQEMTDAELHAELDRQIAEEKRRAANELAFGSESSGMATG